MMDDGWPAYPGTGDVTHFTLTFAGLLCRCAAQWPRMPSLQSVRGNSGEALCNPLAAIGCQHLAQATGNRS